MLLLHEYDLVHQLLALQGDGVLLQLQVAAVQHRHHSESVLRGPESRPRGRIGGEAVNFLSTASRPCGDMNCRPWVDVGKAGVRTLHHLPIEGGEKPLIAVLMSPDG